MEKRDLAKQERETTLSKELRNMSISEKLFRGKQAKADKQSHPQNKPEADRESTSSTKDLAIKPGDQDVPRHRDRKLELQQSLWKERPKQGDHVAPNFRQRKSNAGQQYWRQKQGGHDA